MYSSQFQKKFKNFGLRVGHKKFTKVPLNAFYLFFHDRSCMVHKTLFLGCESQPLLSLTIMIWNWQYPIQRVMQKDVDFMMMYEINAYKN